MSFVDKFKDLVGIEEFEDDEIPEVIDKPVVKQEPKPVRTQVGSGSTGNKVVSIPRGTTVNTHPFKMVVLEPKGFEEAPKLVDNLKGRKPVIVNLERLESDTARKIFDFLSGATYALNGNVQKVANNIFIFAPENVDINSGVEHKTFDYQGAKKW